MTTYEPENRPKIDEVIECLGRIYKNYDKNDVKLPEKDFFSDYDIFYPEQKGVYQIKTL